MSDCLAKVFAFGALLFNIVVSGGYITTSSKSVTLTANDQDGTGSGVTDVASVSLIPNGSKNRISTANDFRCTQGNYNTFCVELDVFNTGCPGIETIEISVHGGRVSGDVDLYSIFSVINENNEVEFISYFTDWDGGMKYATTSATGGAFVAPQCGQSSLMKYIDSNDIVGTLWDRMGASTDAWFSRKPLVNMDLNNWYLLTEESVGTNTSPIKFKFVNDLYSNTLTTTFEADGVSPVSCKYNDAFGTKSGNDYVMAFQTDQATIKFTQFDVKTTCQIEETKTNNCESQPMDIYFSMDSSLSVTEANWPLMKDFVTDLIETEIDISSRVAVNDFAKGAWIDWQFTDTQNPRTDMLNAIDNIAFPTINGQTWTKDAIQLVIDEYEINGRSLDDADRLLVLMTDGKPTDSQSPCGLKDELDALGIKVLVLGIGNNWITKGGRDLMTCMVDDETNDMIYIPEFTQEAFDQVKGRVSQAICPTCEYTHTCKAKGDPHITTYDGTLYHFQGSGYFDYLKACTESDSEYMPVRISALQLPWPKNPKAATVAQVIVSLSDGNNPYAEQITFPRAGTGPILSNGQSAKGTYSLNNGRYSLKVGKMAMEIEFNLNDGTGRRGKIWLTYKGYTLIIKVSDCISEYLCGLCGKLNNNPNDDFETCDTFEIIDNSGSAAYYHLPSEQKAVVQNNVNEFGESCCNKYLDEELLGTTDCEITDPVIPTDCMDTDTVYNLCLAAWNNICNSCDDTFSPPSEEWLINCEYDICLNNDCNTAIMDDYYNDITLTLAEAENMECLDTIKSECEVECPVTCDEMYDAIKSNEIEAKPFYRWMRKIYDNNGNIRNGNHFYTGNEYYDGTVYGYEKEDIEFEGYIWTEMLPNGFGSTLYRFRSNEIFDHFYSVNGDGIDSIDEKDHNHALSSYIEKTNVGYVMTTECPSFNQPLYRYWSNLYRDHFYTITKKDYENYEYETIAGYVAKYEMPIQM